MKQIIQNLKTGEIRDELWVMSDAIKTHKDLKVWQAAMKLAKEMGMVSSNPETHIDLLFEECC